MLKSAATVPSPDADPLTGRETRGQAPVLAQRMRRRPAPLLNDIYVRACQKWQAAGQPAGDGARFWLQAEQELLRETAPDALVTAGSQRGE